ncbi:MGDG synthase family glycosyltransferase [Paenibacillus senegalensis]|uniref:MGDG synthase family glycosyltransferase n=1 Tax=Paenibacillus senegalensis TaxID=1465766 RepID=UPI00028A3FA6|nr:glycosyltransferase [Paenibacillus senegalensis]
MKKKRILLLSEGFGHGHTQAAHALSIGLRRLSSNITTKVIELGAFQHPLIAPWIFSAYRKTVTAQPKLYGFLYRYQYKKSLNRFAQMALHRMFYAKTSQIIEQLKPSVIVCTHPFPNVIVSRLKRAGLDIPLCTVITDYDAHGTWISKEVNRYFVSTDQVRDKLLARQVEAEKIKVTGIPVHPDFLGISDPAEIRSRLGWNELPAVLIMGGGWGLMDEYDLISVIKQWNDRLQFIVVAGSNEKLKQTLEERPELKSPNVHILGFTKGIDKLMEAADLLITKPGGMTCTEGLVKGIPMLFYHTIPGQEEENLQYFTENGFAEKITAEEDLHNRFQQLLDNYPAFLKKREILRHMRADYSPQRCSQALVEYLEQL